MATADHDELVFYPAFCFRASQTHFTWVKIAALDVHLLKKRRGFEGQNIFFYLNHPIRFVSLVGIIVAKTDVYKRTILTLDDSSGATIEIAVLKADNGSQQYQQVAETSLGGENQAPAKNAIEHVAATNKTELDITDLVPGVVVQVKGTLSMFRSVMQIQLERFFLVRDTNAEMRFLDQRSRYLVEVLSVPWRLTEGEVRRLQIEADEEEEKLEEERERARRRHRKRIEREERDQQRIQKMWEREEKVRKKESIHCQEAGIKTMRDIERKRARMD